MNPVIGDIEGFIQGAGGIDPPRNILQPLQISDPPSEMRALGRVRPIKTVIEATVLQEDEALPAKDQPAQDDRGDHGAAQRQVGVSIQMEIKGEGGEEGRQAIGRQLPPVRGIDRLIGRRAIGGAAESRVTV